MKLQVEALQGIHDRSKRRPLYVRVGGLDMVPRFSLDLVW